MSKEIVTEIPLRAERLPVQRGLGAIVAELISVVPFRGNGTVIEPGTPVSDGVERIVPIENQAGVYVNPETVPGTDAYAAKQERIANDIRSNKFH